MMNKEAFKQTTAYKQKTIIRRNDGVARVYINNFMLAGVADCDYRTHNNENTMYGTFTVSHKHVDREDEVRNMLLSVFVPLHLHEDAAHIRKGDNVIISGRLRITYPAAQPPQPEVVASNIGVLRKPEEMAHGSRRTVLA